jgi:hypothetical protein
VFHLGVLDFSFLKRECAEFLQNNLLTLPISLEVENGFSGVSGQSHPKRGPSDKQHGAILP